MDAKEAIGAAKTWIADIYAGESIANVGLEEVKFDDTADEWLITVGFSRPWDRTVVASITGGPHERRSYKVVRLRDRDGRVLSVEERVFAT